MNSGTKIIGVLVAAGAIIGLSVWLGRQNQPKPADPGAPAESPTTTTTTSTPANAPVNVPSVNAKPVAVTSNATAVITTSTNDTAPIADWNEKIDEALKSGGEDRDVAKSLLKLFPRFPTEGRVEAVQHISNLLPDEDYPELAKLMEDAKQPEEVLDELIMDLLNRPNKIMLPELLKVARTPEHAKAGEAKDFLELYLEEDYGTDWNVWQAKMEEWLKANPD